MSVRVAVALIVAALASALGALILGEYEFSGATPFGAGILFGLVISELVIEIGHKRAPVLGVVSAVFVAGALAWAAHISSGEGLRPFPTGGWIALVLGGLTAGLRVGRPVRPVTDAA